MSTPTSPTRTQLMQQHVAARQRRDAAQLGSEDYRLACEEIARIEVAIAAAEEPAPTAAGAPAAEEPAPAPGAAAA
jgi:hypothetical protein